MTDTLSHTSKEDGGMLDILKVEQDIELLVCGRRARFRTPLGAAFGCVQHVLRVDIP